MILRTACAVAVLATACNFTPLARLGDAGGLAADSNDMAPRGEVSLDASPSLFLLHQNDLRGVTITLTNQGTEPAALGVPPALTASGLDNATLTFPTTDCPETLEAGRSCHVEGTIVATGTGRASFRVAINQASVTMTMTAMPPCPRTCGPAGTSNCCASARVPGNAIGSTNAGDLFFRGHDVAPDNAHPSTDFPATVSDFRLDTYLVSVGRFRSFVAAGMGTAHTSPTPGAGGHAAIADSGWDATWRTSLADSTDSLIAAIKCSPTYQTWTDEPGQNEGLPINCLNWYEAMAFCIWDGGYLATEAEWNYAASGGGEQRAYVWSSPASSLAADCSYANYQVSAGVYCTNRSSGGVNRVGSESPRGDALWGHSDMGGNVGAWVLDWYNEPYPVPCDDAANLTTAFARVVRGGTFSQPVSYLRTGFRDYFMPTARYPGIGVRCARIP